MHCEQQSCMRPCSGIWDNRLRPIAATQHPYLSGRGQISNKLSWSIGLCEPKALTTSNESHVGPYNALGNFSIRTKKKFNSGKEQIQFIPNSLGLAYTCAWWLQWNRMEVFWIHGTVHAVGAVGQKVHGFDEHPIAVYFALWMHSTGDSNCGCCIKAAWLSDYIHGLRRWKMEF